MLKEKAFKEVTGRSRRSLAGPPAFEDIHRAKTAFTRFKLALESLEESMQPLDSDMSPALKGHLTSVGYTARKFFFQANWELFSTYQQCEQKTIEVRNE